ncbi:hypothetical protein [Fulvivirga sediminis]|uniref:Outer membrane protein beta-barrel domain-containing protein n=1 Tax=Fulvivirga sediminis TaxID=2803949 RepID=A0A937F5Q7_9BACT|nr:hypothetical protein [Fulvivirga sediminis]MBL3654598.1 hypothetical protein [Fulvivirga sediminis]
MKKVLRSTILIALVFFGFNLKTNAQGFEPGQGFRQVNFGLGFSDWGVPVYAGMDFGVSDKVTIGPRVSYRRRGEDFWVGGRRYDYHYNIFNIGFRGDYHYGGHISGLPQELDLYGGLTLGATIWGDNYDGPGNDLEDSGALVKVQAGGRWYFSKQWAANAELYSGNRFSGLDFGLSYSF